MSKLSEKEVNALITVAKAVNEIRSVARSAGRNQFKAKKALEYISDLSESVHNITGVVAGGNEDRYDILDLEMQIYADVLEAGKNSKNLEGYKYTRLLGEW